MTMHEEFTKPLDTSYRPLSYDELLVLMERGRRMRSRALRDYMVGLFGLLRRTFERRDRGADERQQPARHANPRHA